MFVDFVFTFPRNKLCLLSAWNFEVLAYKDGNYGPVDSHLLNELLVYINFVVVCYKTWTSAMILELVGTILYGSIFYIKGPPRLGLGWGTEVVWLL